MNDKQGLRTHLQAVRFHKGGSQLLSDDIAVPQLHHLEVDAFEQRPLFHHSQRVLNRMTS
ncbi:hypothetical protein DPMN_161789 [Dreissena polymorpha]|uniref:Uncharacterized protein n=1 Tax=Dreissena polymorpha TaxID=45954 RepID=A0A9D4EQI8_DREPO|nr:hypothetical protein DPMN_161789 [Dreissena polymorpha]